MDPLQQTVSQENLHKAVLRARAILRWAMKQNMEKAAAKRKEQSQSINERRAITAKKCELVSNFFKERRSQNQRNKNDIVVDQQQQTSVKANVVPPNQNEDDPDQIAEEQEKYFEKLTALLAKPPKKREPFLFARSSIDDQALTRMLESLKIQDAKELQEAKVPTRPGPVDADKRNNNNFLK